MELLCRTALLNLKLRISRSQSNVDLQLGGNSFSTFCEMFLGWFRAMKPSLTTVVIFHRPGLSPLKFEFTIFNESLTSPGYVLMAPYTVPLGSNLADTAGSSLESANASAELALFALFEADTVQNGPYIFDDKGVRSRFRTL